MKFQVKQWERVHDDDDNYEDVYHDIGVRDITLGQASDGFFVGMMGDKSVKFFSLVVTPECIKVYGFDSTQDPYNYVQYQLYHTKGKE